MQLSRILLPRCCLFTLWFGFFHLPLSRALSFSPSSSISLPTFYVLCPRLDRTRPSPRHPSLSPPIALACMLLLSPPLAYILLFRIMYLSRTRDCLDGQRAKQKRSLPEMYYISLLPCLRSFSTFGQYYPTIVVRRVVILSITTSFLYCLRFDSLLLLSPDSLNCIMPWSFCR